MFEKVIESTDAGRKKYSLRNFVGGSMPNRENRKRMIVIPDIFLYLGSKQRIT
jgi:hypothetical protein